jgi:pyridoxine 5-phosphate synthase
VITSNEGWNTIKNEALLTDVITEFQMANIRTSIFIDTDLAQIENVPKTGADRIELYTESYAVDFSSNKEAAVDPFVRSAKLAYALGLGVNAGHDLNLENLNYFANQVPYLDEVSIGHALIADALYLGLDNTIQLYLRELMP